MLFFCQIDAVIVSGKTVPSGAVFQAASGERYCPRNAYRLDADGQAAAAVKAENPGQRGNPAEGEKLSIVLAVPAGTDSRALVSGGGITGGTDAETDGEYPARAPAALRNPSRCGKQGGFALWAKDAGAEVSGAWEFKNFGVSGAAPARTVKGSRHTGVYPADNPAEVRNYISADAPPVLFEVRSPVIKPVSPAAALLPVEDSQANRDPAETRMKTYMRLAARPGARITAGALRLAVIDGVIITDITVRLGGSRAGSAATAILEYPYTGETTREQRRPPKRGT